jgi:hypothetical protein
VCGRQRPCAPCAGGCSSIAPPISRNTFASSVGEHGSVDSEDHVVLGDAGARRDGAGLDGEDGAAVRGLAEQHADAPSSDMPLPPGLTQFQVPSGLREYNTGVF